MTGRDVTPAELVRMCRERAAWYERHSPDTPRALWTIQLHVDFEEDMAGHFAGRVVEEGGCLIETPLAPLFEQALDVATRHA